MNLKKEVNKMKNKQMKENEKTTQPALLYIGAGLGENAEEYL